MIYRHPQNNISNYQSNLCALLNDFNTYKKSYYICGDINLDLLKHDTVPKIRNYAESLNCLGCIPVLCYPTRVTSATATLIDHVYTNDLKNNVKCYILKQGCATFFTGGPLSKILTTSRASHRQICIKL